MGFANTEYDVNSNSADLTSASSYTVGGTTTATPPGTTSDVTFTNTTYTTTAFTINSNLSIGTLDDLNATQALSISNTGAAATTLTLNGGTNSVAPANANGGAANDLLFVASGGNLTLTGGTGATALNLALAANGNFDVAGSGAATISSVISGSFALTKTGSGTLTLSGASANTYGGTGGTILNAGTLQLNGASNAGLSTNGPLTLNGGTLGLGSGLSFGNSIVLGGTVTVSGSGTGTNTIINSTTNTLSGSGTLNFALPGGTVSIRGTMSTFSGTLALGTSTGTLQLGGSNFGSKTAIFDLGSSTAILNTGGVASTNITVDLGALQATGSGTRLNGTQTGGSNVTYSVGALNSSTTFAGRITDTNTSTAFTGLAKVGTGTLTLTNTGNSFRFGTTITQGTLLAAPSASASQIIGTGAVALNGGTLAFAPTGTGANISLSSGLNVASGNVFTYGGGGTLSLNKNTQSSVTYTAGTAAGTTLARTGAGTLVIDSVNNSLGNLEKFMAITAPTLTNGIVNPSIVGTTGATPGNGDFLTYTANGFVTTTYTETNFVAPTTTTVENNANPTTISAPTTVYALKNSSSVTVNNAQTLTIGNGSGQAGLILNGGTIVNATGGVGTTDFGAAEATIYGGTAGGTISTAITGSGGLTKFGPGTVNITGASANSGATTINQGALAVNNDGGSNLGALTSTPSVTVNGGGTLLLSGSSSVTDRINNAATVTVNAQGSNIAAINTAGLSEGTAGTAGLGALTLASSSIIDLGAGSSVLHFAASNSQTWTGILSIYNYSGSSSGGGTDQLLFGSNSTALTSTQLGEISFYSDSGATFLGAGTFAPTNNGEVVPVTAVPEPATVLGGCLLLGLAVWRERRRLARGWNALFA